MVFFVPPAGRTFHCIFLRKAAAAADRSNACYSRPEKSDWQRDWYFTFLEENLVKAENIEILHHGQEACRETLDMLDELLDIEEKDNDSSGFRITNLTQFIPDCIKKLTGVLIQKEITQGLVFERFSTAQRQGTFGEKSTGLGLCFAKKTKEFQDSRMWFESKEGIGTTFY